MIADLLRLTKMAWLYWPPSPGAPGPDTIEAVATFGTILLVEDERMPLVSSREDVPGSTPGSTRKPVILTSAFSQSVIGSSFSVFSGSLRQEPVFALSPPTCNQFIRREVLALIPDQLREPRL